MNIHIVSYQWIKEWNCILSFFHKFLSTNQALRRKRSEGLRHWWHRPKLSNAIIHKQFVPDEKCNIQKIPQCSGKLKRVGLTDVAWWSCWTSRCWSSSWSRWWQPGSRCSKLIHFLNKSLLKLTPKFYLFWISLIGSWWWWSGSLQRFNSCCLQIFSLESTNIILLWL